MTLGVRPVFRTVDTCAGEFPARTPYHYSAYEEQDEVRPAARPRVLILGAGPNRIGQGIEFDYACVHAAFALAEAGFEAVMINSNPETVSTDYDTAPACTSSRCRPRTSSRCARPNGRSA